MIIGVLSAALLLLLPLPCIRRRRPSAAAVSTSCSAPSVERSLGALGSDRSAMVTLPSMTSMLRGGMSVSMTRFQPSGTVRLSPALGRGTVLQVVSLDQ